MKNKIKLLGIIAFIVIIGLFVISCDSKCPGGGTSGGEGNCQFSYDPNNHEGGLIQRYCANLDCTAYKKALEYILAPGSFTAKVTVNCGC